jgi:tetratricopeptide (TPR) repeat protein
MTDAETVLRQALASLRGGRAAEAEAMLREQLRAAPADAGARQLLGIVLLERGLPREALLELDAVAALFPTAPLHYNRGNALAALGRLEEAAAAYAQACALQPGLAPAQLNAGSVALRLGRDEEAIAAFDRALALDARLADAHNERGVALHRLGRTEEALAAFDAAIALQADSADAWNNRGNALHDLRRLPEALAAIEQALRLRPGFPEATSNHGLVLQDLRRLPEAEQAYTHALALRERNAEALRRRAALRLLQGHFAEGWSDYELAHEFAALDPAPGKRWWRGEPLAGSSILLSEPNGLGDLLQFLRFVPRLLEGGARVSLAAPARMHRLLSSFEPGLRLIGLEDAERHDYHCWLWNLPHWLGLGGQVEAAAMPYLHAEPARVQRWSRMLDPACLNVGIAWQGNPARRIDRGRSIALREFAPLARVPGVRLVSLQKEFGLAQLDCLPEGMQVQRPEAGFDEGPDAFVDSAALLASLDLVVSADSSLTHLAGAMARPAWLALNPVPDWRWQLDREDSPWYPSVRLFRQAPGGSWAGVFERMALALAEAAPALRAGRSR